MLFTHQITIDLTSNKLYFDYAEIKERAELYPYFLSGPSVACYRVSFTFTFILHFTEFDYTLLRF